MKNRSCTDGLNCLGNLHTGQDTKFISQGKIILADVYKRQAYDDKFDTKTIAPLHEADGVYFLELYHGATIAFKMCIRDSHTTLDTSANPYTEKEPWHTKWLELMKYTDLMLLDIKQIDEKEHIKLTGCLLYTSRCV